jgi:1,4-alpha-glucan branching enzyme
MATQKAGKKKVTFQIQTDPGSKVFVAGTFNNWDPTKNKMKEKNGVYSTSILLEPGRYEYKFIINDVWCIDPSMSDWQPNSMGSLNSVIEVS